MERTTATPLSRKKYMDRLFSLPAIIVVAVVTQVPFVITVIFSLLRWNLVKPEQGITFNWFNNYIYYFKSKEFWQVVLQTVELTVISLVMCTVLGFLFALLLNHNVPFVNISRTLLLGPFFVMSTASGVVWKTTILNTTFGWYGVLMRALGLQPVDLLSYHSLATVAFLFVWQWLPFFILVILAGLQGIDEEVLESATLDGCNWFTMTFRIKLPMIFNHIQVAVMLGLLFVAKEFGLILVTTAGGPGTSSYNLPFYVYKIVFNASNVGRAACVSVITVILTTVAVQLLYRTLKRRREKYG